MRFPHILGGPIVEAALAADQAPDLSAAALVPHQVGLQSPMSEPNHLEAVVWADLTGQTANILSRSAAMGIPALARQRHLMCGVAAKCPLRLVGPDDTPAAVQPSWMTQGSHGVPAFHRMLWTVDDLIFGPFSVWATERSGRGGLEDPITDAWRIPTERWETDQADRLMVDGELADEADYLVIPGPHEGILNFGAGALRRTIDNLEAAATAARNPSAYLELHYTGAEPLTPEQKTELVGDWAKARRGENGGVAYTGPNLEVREHGTHESHLLIEGRNADAVDVSRLVSSPAAMADATSSGASLTYETTEGRNVQFLDYGASLYMDAIAARLSMDDVAGADARVAFDVSQVTALSAPATGSDTQE